MAPHRRVETTPHCTWGEPTRAEIDDFLDCVGRNMDRVFERMERLEAAGAIDLDYERSKRRRNSDAAD